MYNIKALINCNTTFVVYRLLCKCRCFYIGRTKRRLKDRVSEHKNAIRKANLDYPMAKRFQNVHNSNPEGLMVEGLKTIKNLGWWPIKITFTERNILYIQFTGQSVPWVEWEIVSCDHFLCIYLFGLNLQCSYLLDSLCMWIFTMYSHLVNCF